jgi:hypothetical protein
MILAVEFGQVLPRISELEAEHVQTVLVGVGLFPTRRLHTTRYFFCCILSPAHILTGRRLPLRRQLEIRT